MHLQYIDYINYECPRVIPIYDVSNIKAKQPLEASTYP